MNRPKKIITKNHLLALVTLCGVLHLRLLVLQIVFEAVKLHQIVAGADARADLRCPRFFGLPLDLISFLLSSVEVLEGFGVVSTPDRGARTSSPKKDSDEYAPLPWEQLQRYVPFSGLLATRWCNWDDEVDKVLTGIRWKNSHHSR